MDLTSNKIIEYIAKNEPVAITKLGEKFEISWPIMFGMIKHLRHSGQVEGNDGNLRIRSKDPTSRYEYKTLNFSGHMYGGSDNPSCQANQWLEKNSDAEVLSVSIYTEAEVRLSTMAMAVRIPLNS